LNFEIQNVILNSETRYELHHSKCIMLLKNNLNFVIQGLIFGFRNT